MTQTHYLLLHGIPKSVDFHGSQLVIIIIKHEDYGLLFFPIIYNRPHVSLGLPKPLVQPKYMYSF